MKNIIILILIITLQQSLMYKITLEHRRKLLKTNKFLNPVQYGPPATTPPPSPGSTSTTSKSSSASTSTPAKTTSTPTSTTSASTSTSTSATPVLKTNSLSISDSLSAQSQNSSQVYNLSISNYKGSISKSIHIKDGKDHHSHKRSKSAKPHKGSHGKDKIDFHLKLNVSGGNGNNNFTSTCSIEELNLCTKKCEFNKDTVSYCGNSKMTKNEATSGVLIDKQYDCICKNDSNKLLSDSKNNSFATQPPLQVFAQDNITNQTPIAQPPAGEVRPPGENENSNTNNILTNPPNPNATIPPNPNTTTHPNATIPPNPNTTIPPNPNITIPPNPNTTTHPNTAIPPNPNTTIPPNPNTTIPPNQSITNPPNQSTTNPPNITKNKVAQNNTNPLNTPNNQNTPSPNGKLTMETQNPPNHTTGPLPNNITPPPRK